jgi:uncharacterized membrane protein
MAGVGFELRRLTRSDDLAGLVRAYGHASVVSGGPWLMTVLAIAAVTWFVVGFDTMRELELFRTILIYNFAFSLTLTSPVALVTTRFLSDQIYLKNVERAPGMLLGSLIVNFTLQAPLAAAFYAFVPDLPGPLAVLSVINYLVIAALWQVTVFLTALKDYRTVTLAFAGGIAVAVAASVVFGFPYGTFGLLGGFTAGFALIVFVIIARILAEYRHPLKRPMAFLAYCRPYWELPIAGLLYAAAIWADKWIMWFAPDRVLTPEGLAIHPFYDSAMFFAYLTIVPSLALFMIMTETSFFERYVAFYRTIQRHGTYAQILGHQKEIVDTLAGSLRNLIVLQGTVSFAAIVLAPQLLGAFGIAYHHIGMFRIGVLGALFHALFLFAMIILTYFDLRRDMVVATATFLGANALFTLGALELGFPYYGYGYFLAALIAACVALGIVSVRLAKLPYLTFVVCNPSVGGADRKRPEHGLAPLDIVRS